MSFLYLFNVIDIFRFIFSSNRINAAATTVVGGVDSNSIPNKFWAGAKMNSWYVMWSVFWPNITLTISRDRAQHKKKLPKIVSFLLYCCLFTLLLFVIVVVFLFYFVFVWPWWMSLSISDFNLIVFVVDYDVEAFAIRNDRFDMVQIYIHIFIQTDALLFIALLNNRKN